MQSNDFAFKEIMDIAPNPIFIYADQKIIYVNHEAVKLINAVKKEDLLGKPFIGFIHPDSIQSVTQSMKELIENKKPIVKLYQKIITLTNEIIEVEVSASITNINNQQAIIGIANDLTSIKKLNKLLIEKDEKLTSIIQQIPHLLFFITKKGIIKEFYNAHKIQLYTEPEKFLNKNISEVLPYDVSAKIHEKIETLCITNKTQKIEYELTIENQTQHYQAYLIPYKENEILVSILEMRVDEYLFKTLFTESFSIKLIIDPTTGNILNANKAACNFYGYTHDEITHLNINQINTMTDEEIKIAIQEAKTGQRNFFRFKHRLKNGEIKHVEVYSSKLILNNQEVLYSIVHDKTDVVLSEQKFKNLFDNLIEAYALNEIITDKNGKPVDYRFIEINEAFLSLTHTNSKEEIIGKTVKELWPETEQYWIEIYGKVALENQRLSFENYWKVLDRWYLVNAYSPQKGQFAVSFIDITKLKKTQEQLLLFEKAIQNVPVSIVITDVYGTIQYVNPYFSQITGYSVQEAIGQNPKILQSGKHHQDFYKQLWETILSGETWVGELYNKKKDGTFYWESARISPILNKESNEITNFVVVKLDVTKQKQMQEDLLRAKEKAEQSEKLKANFLANMSHEIRTPLNSIIGFTEILKHTPTTEEERQKYLHVISQSSDRLFNLINDILEVSKINAGEIKIENNTIEVEKEFSLLYENFLLEAQVKDLKLLLNPTYPERLLIETDKSKFLSIVTNLVKNAIKYTHKGFVEFGYVYQNEHIEIIVNDTGIGIPKEKHDIIFNRFMQVDNRADKPYEGVGLGLSIVKAYVEMLHGTIELSSEKDKGTTFKVKLPAKQQSTIENQTQEEQAVIATQHHPCEQILIVEDDKASASLLDYHLSKYCKKTIVADSVLEALEIFKTKKFKIVFTDIKLPDMNGFELIKKIKTVNPSVIVVAQSGFAMEDDIKAALSEGFDFYLTKPISEKAIHQIMSEILKIKN